MWHGEVGPEEVGGLGRNGKQRGWEFDDRAWRETVFDECEKAHTCFNPLFSVSVSSLSSPPFLSTRAAENINSLVSVF